MRRLLAVGVFLVTALLIYSILGLAFLLLFGTECGRTACPSTLAFAAISLTLSAGLGVLAARAFLRRSG